MSCCEPHTVGVGQLAPCFRCHFQQIRMRQRYYFFLRNTAVRGDPILHIDCVCVTDGDTVLKPAKLDLPHASERIWACFKQARRVTHDPMLTRTTERLKGL